MAPARKRWLTDGLNLDSNLREPLPLDYPPRIPGACRSAADSVVYCVPPPVAAGDAQSDDSDRPRAFPIPLDLSPRRREFEGREKSAWVGSIIVHAAIVLLITLLIAPADFSGYTTQTLVMTLSEEQPEISIPMMLVDDVASEDSSLLAEVEQDPEIAEPVEVSLDVARPVIKLAGMKTKSGKSVGNVSGGARGSFFGIEAVGQDFVYIVDRSGSMNGVRYRRAIDELTRSIRELREDQRFFVLLFSSSSTPMFNGVQSMDMMQATAENKERLEDWLATIGTGGGTNPNSSLRTALRMNPNAVFILSDGEFTDTHSGDRGSLLKAGGDAISIAKASGTSIPIHAIAFEDPRSCKNMKELADLTGGEYRFVNSSGKTQRELLADARALMAEPKSKSRMRRQGQLSHQMGSIQVSPKAKQTYADLLVDDFEDAYGKIGESDASAPLPPLSELRGLLEALVRSDPRRIAIASLQDKVAGELSRRLHDAANTDEVETTCDAIIRWGGSRAATSVLDRVADHLATLNQDEPSKAFTRLRLIKGLHPQSKAVDVCQALCDRIRDRIVQQSDQLLQRGDLVAAIRMLRTTSSGQYDPTVRSLTYQTLRDLTMKQLAAARDASLSHNRELKDSINAQLEQGFEDDPLLDQWRKERVSRELNARRMLLQVGNNHRYGGIKQKRQHLQAIIDRYPEAIAATQARAQLEKLPRWDAEVEQEESELIRMMDDTRRR